MKSGFIAIIGKPNAGKSTLLNSLINEKVAIVSNKAQTTRNAILGIFNRDDLQMVFIDTPGIHKPSSSLGNYMNKEAMSQAAGVDIIYYLVDASKGLTDFDTETLDKLKSYEVPIFLIINKVDEISKDKLIQRIDYATKNYDFNEIIPISALFKDNLEELIKTSAKYLHDENRYYDENTKTVSTLEFRISEIIREKVILNTLKEVPHLVACKVEEIKERESKVFIEATIISNKDSHKAIIIGKQGKMLKKINDSASYDIRALFNNKRIILSLYVKVEEDWLNKEKKLFELGYFKGDKDE